MRRGILAWLLLIICCTALSYHACEGAVTPQYKTLKRREQLRNVYETMSESKEKGERRRLVGVMHEVDLKSFQRAKGVYGGGDMLRPRTKSKNGASSLLLKSSTILSKTFGYAVVGLAMFFVVF
ncbi:unnamed protein product [Dovyalis caffra]|uniref:Uncharacterized protein n=1 Tax=Dovyalis caffra TaxID=77055 RepID=A0AAV1RSA6_9ROSI|nr:unnamed protein product [Dovyalis caffra]